MTDGDTYSRGEEGEGARRIGKKGWRTGLLRSQAGPCSKERKGAGSVRALRFFTLLAG